MKLRAHTVDHGPDDGIVRSVELIAESAIDEATLTAMYATARDHATHPLAQSVTTVESVPVACFGSEKHGGEALPGCCSPTARKKRPWPFSLLARADRVRPI